MWQITKMTRGGIVKEIRNENNKIIREVIANGKLYRRNTLYKTYNSVDGNELLVWRRK